MPTAERPVQLRRRSFSYSDVHKTSMHCSESVVPGRHVCLLHQDHANDAAVELRNNLRPALLAQGATADETCLAMCHNCFMWSLRHYGQDRKQPHKRCYRHHDGHVVMAPKCRRKVEMLRQLGVTMKPLDTPCQCADCKRHRGSLSPPVRTQEFVTPSMPPVPVPAPVQPVYASTAPAPSDDPLDIQDDAQWESMLWMVKTPNLPKQSQMSAPLAPEKPLVPMIASAPAPAPLSAAVVAPAPAPAPLNCAVASDFDVTSLNAEALKLDSLDAELDMEDIPAASTLAASYAGVDDPMPVWRGESFGFDWGCTSDSEDEVMGRALSFGL